MTDENLITDTDVIDAIVSAIEQDNKDELVNAIPKDHNLNCNLLINEERCSIPWLCYLKNKTECLELALQKKVVNGIDMVINDLIGKAKNDKDSKYMLGVVLESCIASNKGFYEKIRDDIFSIFDCGDIFEFIFSHDMNIVDFIRNCDITILIEEFFKAPFDSVWRPSSFELFNLILCKKQDLKQFDSEFFLIHKAITYDIPICDNHALKLLLWHGCDPNQHGKYAVLIDLVNSSFEDPEMYETLIVLDVM